MADLRRTRLGFGAFALALAASFAASTTGADAWGRHRATTVAQAAPGSPAPLASAAPGTAAPAEPGAPAPGVTAQPLPGVTAAPSPQGTTLSIPSGTGSGPRFNRGQPTPFPITTLAPLTGASQLPYPAFGTPVPGVNAGVAAADVPVAITLDQAEAIGFARSPMLAAARADVIVQAASVRLQQAGLLPLVAGNASYTYQHAQRAGGGTTGTFGGGTTTGNGNVGTTGTTTSNLSSRSSATSAAFDLTLRQLIYDGGRTASAIAAAVSTERSGADTYRRDLQTVAYNVATAYYNDLAAERLVQVDREIVRQDQVQVDLVTAQVRAGTEARAQIATAQLPLAQARLAVVRAQGSALSNAAAFANAMGLDANVLVSPVDDAPVFTNTQISSVPVPTYDVAVARALQLRPDYDSALQLVESGKYNVRTAGLGRFPTLATNASASDASTDASAGAFRNSQSVGLTLSIPIYDQGVTAANVLSARAQLDRDYATLQSTALSVQLGVKQALVNLVSARAALDQTQQEYRTAVVNVQSTQAQYRAGVTTLPLLLNAEVQLTQALTDQVTAVYTLRGAEQTYLYNVGANVDTSGDIGTLRVRPVPGPQAQGGRSSAHPH